MKIDGDYSTLDWIENLLDIMGNPARIAELAALRKNPDQSNPEVYSAWCIEAGRQVLLNVVRNKMLDLSLPRGDAPSDTLPQWLIDKVAKISGHRQEGGA